MEVAKILDKTWKNSRSLITASIFAFAINTGILIHGIYNSSNSLRINAQGNQNQTDPYIDPHKSNQLLLDFIKHESELNIPNSELNASSGMGEPINNLSDLRDKSKEFYKYQGDIQNIVSGIDMFELVIQQGTILSSKVHTLTVGEFDIEVNGDGFDCVQGRQLGDEFPNFVSGKLVRGETHISGPTSEDHGKKVIGNYLSMVSNQINMMPIITVEAYPNTIKVARTTDYNDIAECVRKGYSKTEYDLIVANTHITQEVELHYGGTFIIDAFNAMYENNVELISISMAYDHNTEDLFAVSDNFVTIIENMIKRNPNMVISLSAGNNGMRPYDVNGDGIVYPEEGTTIHWAKLCERFPKNVILSGAITHSGNPVYFTAKSLYRCGVSGIGENAFTFVPMVDLDNNGIEDVYQVGEIIDDNPDSEDGDVKYITERFRGTSASQSANLGIISNIVTLQKVINAGLLEGLNKIDISPVEILEESAVLPLSYRRGDEYDTQTMSHSRLGMGYADLFNAQLVILDRAGAFGRDESNLSESNIRYRSLIENWANTYFKIRSDKQISWSEIFRIMDNRESVADYLESLAMYQAMFPIMSSN